MLENILHYLIRSRAVYDVTLMPVRVPFHTLLDSP